MSRIATALALVLRADMAWADPSGGTDPAAPERATAQQSAQALNRPEAAGEIGLREALSRTLQGSPELAAFEWRVRAAEGDLLQAGLRPNPQVDLRAEDIGVSGQVSGFEQAELTIELGQLIELGGKRAARIEQASRGRELATWDYEITRIDVLARTAQAFVAVLVAQRRLELAEESITVARAVVDAAATRVRAGGTSSAELTKAEVALASAIVERGEVLRALEAARRQLAGSWGDTEASFTTVRGDLERTTEPPPIAALAARLDDSPALARWTTELLERRATIELERSRAVPDVTARGGYRRLFSPDENTFVVGVTIPLPLNHRNQGAIAAAESRLAQGRHEQEAARVRLRGALGDSHQAVATAYAQAATLRGEVLPGAREAFALLNAGYREGRFSYLDVLDAQRTLIAARVQYLRALGEYHHSLAALERLLGESISSTLQPAVESGRQ